MFRAFKSQTRSRNFEIFLNTADTFLSSSPPTDALNGCSKAQTAKDESMNDNPGFSINPSRASQGPRHSKSVFGLLKITVHNASPPAVSAWPDSHESLKCSSKRIRTFEAHRGRNTFNTVPGNQQPSARFSDTNGGDKLRRCSSKLCFKQTGEIAR